MTDNSEPAFPCAHSEQTHSNQDGAPYQLGLTKREYYAAQVAGHLMISCINNFDVLPPRVAELAAMQAFALADALIREGGK